MSPELKEKSLFTVYTGKLGDWLEKVFRSKEGAEAECQRLNPTKAGQQVMPAAEYRVSEIEILAEGMESYALARQRIESAMEEARQAAFPAFLVGSRALFDQHPDLQSFGWEQKCEWTPHWEHDEFMVYYDSPSINGFDWAEYYLGEARDLERKLKPHVEAFLSRFGEEDMEEMFGDDVCVTVHRDGMVEVKMLDD
jgi:hypothetical protein